LLTTQMREERDKGIEGPSRSRSVEENLALWKEMLVGSDQVRGGGGVMTGGGA
jgi:hypothetical protein